MGSLDQYGVVTQAGGATRAGDGVGGGLDARSGNQQLSRRRRFPDRGPNALDFLEAQQHGLAGRTDYHVSREAHGIVARDIFAQLIESDRAIGRKGRS